MSRNGPPLERAIDSVRWARGAVADAGIAVGKLTAERRDAIAADLARLDGELAEVLTRLVALEVSR